MRFNGTLFFAILILSACNSGGGPKPVVNPQFNKPEPSPFTRSTRATRYSDEFKVTCESGGCPAGVGVLFISNDLESGLCTAFVAGELEGKTVLMTNRHCAEKIENCADDMAFRLPATNEAAQCSRILKISEYALGSKKTKNNTVPDYAFLLLDRRLNSKILPLSQEGLAPQTPVSIRKAWSTGPRSVEMREHTCATGDAGLLASHYTSALSPNISLYDCKGKGGVSGSPILNARGEVAAIIQMATDGTKNQIPPISGLDANQFDIDTFAVATNLACVDFADLGLMPHESCAANIMAGNGLDKFDPANLLNEWTITAGFIDDYIRFLNEEKNQIFGWTIRPDDGYRVTGFIERRGLITLELAPSCVLRADDDNNVLKSKFYTETRYLGFSGGWSSKGEMVYYTPGWTGIVQLDKYGKISLRFGRGTKAAVYVFSPAQIASLKDDHTVKVIERVLSAEIEHKLPPCAKDHLAREMKESLEMQRLVKSGDQRGFENFLNAVRERTKARAAK